MKRWEESRGPPPSGSERPALVQHPGLERWELAFILGPAATYRNNEDKLRGGRRKERAEAEKRAGGGEGRDGGKEKRRMTCVNSRRRRGAEEEQCLCRPAMSNSNAVGEPTFSKLDKAAR